MALPIAGNDHAYSALPTDDSAEDQSDGKDQLVPGDADINTGETQAEKDARVQEMVRLRAEINRIQDVSDQASKNLSNLHNFWGGKEKDLKHTLEDFARQQSKLDEKLQELAKVGTDKADALPLGPKSLWWVKGGRFTALCSLVVLGNLGTMFMEIVHPSYKEKFFILDQVVLCFYVSEVVLKSLLWRGDLLIGPISIVWWNWLDLLIVIAGVFDQWVTPLVALGAGGNSSKSGNMVQIVKCLRIARLARILKTVHVFLESDLSWAEGNTFQLFIMGTIAANSLLMSFESDFPDFFGWFYVEQVLLVIFSFELTVRLRRWQCYFFYHETDLVWNWLDFVIVFGGIIDQWLMPFFAMVQELLGVEAEKGGSNMGQIMTTLRMARLLRILRLVRLVKNIPPLFTLIVGIMQAMQGMAWVLVLTAVFLYAAALLSVRLVGHGLMFGGQAPPDVADIFPNVGQSMFVLFKVMNGDTEPVEPLFEALPISKLAFVLYMVISSWAILSILTAVVSENMIRATEHNRSELDQEQAFTQDRTVREYLGKLFSDADTDNSNELGEEEFEGMLEDQSICADLTEKTGLQGHELEQIFRFLMTGDKISRETFIDALMSESRPVTERSVFRLEKRLIDLQMMVESHIKSVATQPDARNNGEAATNNVAAKSRWSAVLRKPVASEAPQNGNQTADLVEATAADKDQTLQPVPCKEPGAIKTLQNGDQVSIVVDRPLGSPTSAKQNNNNLEVHLLPFQIALQIVEHRLDSMSHELSSPSCQRTELSSAQREASCEAVLVKLEEQLGMSEHHVRSSLHSILTKIEKSMQQSTEPLMRRLETQLQAHHQSATDSLMSNIEKKLDMSQTWRQAQSDFVCLRGRYENLKEKEVDRGVSAAQAVAAVPRLPTDQQGSPFDTSGSGAPQLPESISFDGRSLTVVGEATAAAATAVSNAMTGLPRVRPVY